MALRRKAWAETIQPDASKLLERLVFIDETSLKTNLVKATGWAPIGQRLVDHAPFGHWRTQTFVAGLAHDGLIAPWVIDGAMNRASFEAYVAHQLAPALRPGQIVRRRQPVLAQIRPRHRAAARANPPTPPDPTRAGLALKGQSAMTHASYVMSARAMALGTQPLA